MDNLFRKFLDKKRQLYQAMIGKEITNYWRAQGARRQSGIPGITKVESSLRGGLGEPSNYLLKTSSKKLRPILGYLMKMALDPAGSNIFERYLILPEILHSSSLIIDDIEDNAKIRRGLPAMHIEYGVDSAINLANAIYFLPYQFVENSRLGVEFKLKINKIFTNSLSRMHLGQGLDIYWHKNPFLTISPQQYLIMARLKTSSFFKAEAELAVIFAKTSASIAKKAIRFAEDVGIAFQITDDVLDLTLDNKEILRFGKDSGQDITEAKKTLIVAYALKRASRNDAKKLKELLGLHTRRKDLIGQAIAILRKYDCIADAKHFSENLIQRSWQDFSRSLSPCRFKEYLDLYCRYTTQRRF